MKKSDETEIRNGIRGRERTRGREKKTHKSKIECEKDQYNLKHGYKGKHFNWFLLGIEIFVRFNKNIQFR